MQQRRIFLESHKDKLTKKNYEEFKRLCIKYWTQRGSIPPQDFDTKKHEILNRIDNKRQNYFRLIHSRRVSPGQKRFLNNLRSQAIPRDVYQFVGRFLEKQADKEFLNREWTRVVEQPWNVLYRSECCRRKTNFSLQVQCIQLDRIRGLSAQKAFLKDKENEQLRGHHIRLKKICHFGRLTQVDQRLMMSAYFIIMDPKNKVRGKITHEEMLKRTKDIPFPVMMCKIDEWTKNLVNPVRHFENRLLRFQKERSRREITSQWSNGPPRRSDVTPRRSNGPPRRSNNPDISRSTGQKRKRAGSDVSNLPLKKRKM